MALNNSSRWIKTICGVRNPQNSQETIDFLSWVQNSWSHRTLYRACVAIISCIPLIIMRKLQQVNKSIRNK
uniref:AlNc14C187G8357 protein n=1 Tax=Albugo laibachii Nc14 TaxID=890382 RepID=F0WPL2_9STRA|nr:AlNc14C187G8357 [Albugo laibachii Nc14]|eukprot:CCA23262.1 AlNc14C187G8357 [Albugo laibachii Nc14]